MLFVLLGALACAPSVDAPSLPVDPPSQAAKPQERTQTRRVDASVKAAVVPESNNMAVPVVLIWEGLSPLHQSFFSDEPAVEQLGRDLAAYVVPPANVYVSFDSRRHIGRILLRLLPDTGMDLVGTGPDVISGVSPVLQGLARYRDAVASRYDTRVAAFRIGVDSYRGTTHCRFGASGPRPPDGTVVDACVLLNGQRVCGDPMGQGVVFDDETQERLRGCLK